ncbi:MAG: hypothetical protein VB031_04210 [Eubacteriaceae bacterium]|nr:hypothetical protein [Eubacteriaceae bacterium]
MNGISWKKNIIKINNEEMPLMADVIEAREIKGIVLVVTTPEDKVLDNLFGISIETGDIWRVQKLHEVYPGFSQTPYVGVSIKDNEVLVTDFCGCRFVVDLMDGKILKQARETR